MTWAKQDTLELVMVHCLECLFWVKFLSFVSQCWVPWKHLFTLRAYWMC